MDKGGKAFQTKGTASAKPQARKECMESWTVTELVKAEAEDGPEPEMQQGSVTLDMETHLKDQCLKQSLKDS